MTVSIIIVTWNSAKYLPRCLEALTCQTFANYETIVVDNGSMDDGVSNLEENWPMLSLRVERLSKNFGFAAANNLGAHLARGKWLALLNADAFPEPDWLENLLQATQDFPAYSCFSSRQVQAQKPELLDGTGDSYHVSGVAWRRNINYPANQFGLNAEEIFTPCAAAALYLREAFLNVSGFDEDFFSYFEDVDVGFRLRLRGYRALYVPGATVFHVGSASFGMNSDFSLYHSHRNLVWTFFKNMPLGLLLKFLPAHMMANLSYMLYYMVRGRGKIVWKAKLDAIRGLPLIFKKRNEIQNMRTVTNVKLLASMERGWLQVYLRGYRHKK